MLVEASSLQGIGDRTEAWGTCLAREGEENNDGASVPASGAGAWEAVSDDDAWVEVSDGGACPVASDISWEVYRGPSCGAWIVLDHDEYLPSHRA